ncbi:hypothetical protein OIU84_012769 [Salix udensis]|uniref:Uncharacterized protein n=1 Tax=Salix udensis TaxID=889485 RepID=A0AAD6NTQ3_9ROSI|nr:hypothetical protein OIU84_012769 [Salix udensis]
MGSVAPPKAYPGCFCKQTRSVEHHRGFTRPRILFCQQQDDDNKPQHQIARREIVLRSSELAVAGAIFNLSGKKPEYLGVQKNQPSNYNGGRKKPVSKEKAMEELLDVIRSTKPEKFTPKIVERDGDYVHVEYSSPILGLVDDVEFWFRPGDNSIVEYRSASRLGNFDFDYNRKENQDIETRAGKERVGICREFLKGPYLIAALLI